VPAQPMRLTRMLARSSAQVLCARDPATPPTSNRGCPPPRRRAGDRLGVVDINPRIGLGQVARRGSEPWPLLCEPKHRGLVTSGNASIAPLNLAFVVVVCRLVLPGCRMFAACSPPIRSGLASVRASNLG